MVLRHYYKTWKGAKHTRVKTGNTTAIGGTVFLKCSKLAQETWEYCIGKQTWISAERIPGREHSKADFMLLVFNEKTEWSLSPAIFLKIMECYSLQVETDFLKTYCNKKIPRYVSWHPETFSYAVDSLTLNWQNLNFYAFPPFSLIVKLISKIIREQALGIMIIPYWPTQNWFPLMAQCLINFPIKIPSTLSALLLPQDSSHRHPLILEMILLAVPLSGQQSKQQIFQKNLTKLFAIHGEQKPCSDTKGFSRN